VMTQEPNRVVQSYLRMLDKSRSAIPPGEACADILKHIDKEVGDDYLAGTLNHPKVSIWETVDPPVKGPKNCCVMS